MIFSKDVLFIHVPRTGGTSVRSFLFQILPRPIYYTFPTPLKGRQDPGIIWVPGSQHENLAEARELAQGYGRDLLRFPLILSTIRNPYDLEVSRYGFFNLGFESLEDPNVMLAFNEDFEVFACKNTEYSGTRALKNYYVLDGRVPANLRIIKFENLVEDFRDALRGMDIESDVTFPHINESRHADFEVYYTKTSEEAVYEKHKWAFDSGFYQRLHPKSSTSEIIRQELRDLKQALRDQRAKQKRLLEAYYASDRWAQELEDTARWAHELEAIAREQQATSRAYQRMLAPFLPFARVGRSLKERFIPRKQNA